MVTAIAVVAAVAVGTLQSGKTGIINTPAATGSSEAKGANEVTDTICRDRSTEGENEGAGSRSGNTTVSCAVLIQTDCRTETHLTVPGHCTLQRLVS